MTNSLGSYLSENVFISFIWLKENFLDIEFVVGWQFFFSFHHLKNTMPVYLASKVSDEKYTVTGVGVLLKVMHYFYLVSFKTFPFILVFKSLIIICLGRDLFVLILLRFHSASWICKIAFCTIYRDFSCYFLCSLLVPHFLLHFWDSDDINARFLPLVLSHSSWYSAYFLFTLFSFCCSNWVNIFFSQIHWFYRLSLYNWCI